MAARATHTSFLQRLAAQLRVRLLLVMGCGWVDRSIDRMDVGGDGMMGYASRGDSAPTRSHTPQLTYTHI